MRHHLRKCATKIKVVCPERIMLADVSKDDLKAQVVRLVHFDAKVSLGHSLHASHDLAGRISHHIDPLLGFLNHSEVRVLEN